MKELFFQKETPVGRGLDTVSHLFLTDRNTREDSRRYEAQEKRFVKAGEGNSARETRSEVCTLLCPDGFSSRGSILGRMLALSMAASDMPVGLIETTTRLPHTFFLSGGYEYLDALFWEADLDSPDFINVVARFQKECDFVFINAAASALLKTTGSGGLAGRCLVPTTVRHRELLCTYGAIKSASKKWAVAEIELVVIKERATDNVAGAVAVLENMAHRFLPCSVRFVGAVTLPENVGMSGGFSPREAPRALPDSAAAAVREIARHLVASAGPRNERKTHVEKRL